MIEVLGGGREWVSRRLLWGVCTRVSVGCCCRLIRSAFVLLSYIPCACSYLGGISAAHSTLGVREPNWPCTWTSLSPHRPLRDRRRRRFPCLVFCSIFFASCRINSKFNFSCSFFKCTKWAGGTPWLPAARCVTHASSFFFLFFFLLFFKYYSRNSEIVHWLLNAWTTKLFYKCAIVKVNWAAKEEKLCDILATKAAKLCNKFAFLRVFFLNHM